MKNLVSIFLWLCGIAILAGFSAVLIMLRPINTYRDKTSDKSSDFEASPFFIKQNSIFQKSTKAKVFTAPSEIQIADFAFDDNNVFISDAFKKRIYKFSKDGNLIWESSGENRFVIPNHKFPISISPEGDLWVANTGMKRLEKLDKSNGKFIASWTPAKNFEFLGCCNPVAFVAISGGKFVTMEKGIKKIKMFLPSGESKIIDQLSSDWSNYDLKFDKDAIFYFDGKKNVKLMLED